MQPDTSSSHPIATAMKKFIWAKNDLSGLKRLTTSSGEDEQPNLSPDASRIVFVSYRSGTPRMWTMDSTGANQAPLATGSESYVPENAPSWSPDGTQDRLHVHALGAVAGVRDPGERAERRFSSSNEMNGAFNPVWSADGTQIYFVSVVGAASLRVVTVATGEKSDWVYDGAGIGQPACSASGCVAVEGAYGSNGDIVSIGQDQSTTMMVGTAANETSPTILVP